MSTTGEPSIEAAERLQGRTVEDSAAKQLPVPNVPDLSAFDMNGNLHMTSESMEKLHQASVETQSIMQKYRAAMREMQVRLEILDQDLNLKKHRNPIHHIESRLKTPASIYEKIGRYGYEATLENMERYILDIAGIRVICPYIQDVYSLFELLNRQDDLEIVKVKDYIASPKPNGYRSLHVIARPCVLHGQEGVHSRGDPAENAGHGLLGKLGARFEVQGRQRGAGHRRQQRTEGLQPHHRGGRGPHAGAGGRLGA